MKTPPLSGRRVRLREVQPADHEYLFALMTHPDVAWRWRYRGHSIPFEEFAQELDAGTLVHFVVESITTGAPLGYLQAFDASLQWGWCHIAVALDPRVAHGGWAIEAPLLFLHYLFEMFDLNKIYASLLEFNFAQFASSAGDRFTVEARLESHEWHAGRSWDLFIIAFYRSNWSYAGLPLVEKVTRPAGVAS